MCFPIPSLCLHGRHVYYVRSCATPGERALATSSERAMAASGERAMTADTTGITAACTCSVDGVSGDTDTRYYMYTIVLDDAIAIYFQQFTSKNSDRFVRVGFKLRLFTDKGSYKSSWDVK